MTDQAVRVGIIGAGRNTRERHIPGLRAIPGVTIAGVVNRSPESSQRAAAALGIPRTYPHWRAAIDDPDTDAIVIGTWPYLHARATVAALEAGKHVLVEARMAMDAAEARAMLTAAQARPDLTAQIVPSPLTLAVDNTVQRLLADGFLGELLAVEVRDYGDFLDLAGPLHWRQDAALSGFNMLSLGIWYEALLRWVGAATRVQAMGRTFVPLRPDASGTLRAVRIPEHLDVIGQMACGAQLHMQISRAVGLAGPSQEATLYGTEGTLRFSGGDQLFGGQRGDDALRPITIPASERGGWRVEAEFIGAVRGQEDVQLTRFEDGLRYMQFTEAVARAMQSGAAIDLPL